MNITYNASDIKVRYAAISCSIADITLRLFMLITRHDDYCYMMPLYTAAMPLR